MEKIIVLIPHYNNVEGLLRSVKSINENIDVDVLVIDDGSTKEVPSQQDIVQNYSSGKVFLDILPVNKGIEYALNRGLELIRKMDYEYIARLDCGDLCAKNRFKKQLDYLKLNSDTFLLGTWANIMNEKNELLYVLKHPITYSEIKKRMFINSMFVHPSVVFRTSLLQHIEGYPTCYKAAEDYAFFFKIVKRFKAENLPEPLLFYILDSNSISTTKRRLQVSNRIKIMWDNFYFGWYPIYGLTRSTLLLLTSRKMTTFVKKVLAKK